MKTATWFLLALVGLTRCKCSEGAPTVTRALEGDENAHRDEEAHEEIPKQVTLSSEAAATAGLRTIRVSRARLAATLKLPGEVVAEPDRTASVSSATAGRIEQVTFNEGDLVKKGQPLATLRVPDIGRLRGAFAAAKAKANAASLNAQRLRVLRADGLGSEQAVTDAEAESQAQEAEARSLAQQLDAIGVNAMKGSGYLVTLRAPISGVAIARNAVAGQPIGAEHVLAVIVDLSAVWFLGKVFEKDLSRLSIGARAEVELNAFPDERFEGAVEYIGQQTDAISRTLNARIRLLNPNSRLRLGLYGAANVEISNLQQATERIVIPRTALTEIAGEMVVFVKAKDGDFVVHHVSLGDSALAQVQVLSGLNEGEEVVTQGVFTLKSLILKSTLIEEEH